MFADDIVLLEESLKQVNNRPNKRRWLALEGKGLKINRSKKEYELNIEYEFVER